MNPFLCACRAAAAAAAAAATGSHRIPFNEVAAMAAADGADYFVRVNDDTEFVSEGAPPPCAAALRSCPARPPRLWPPTVFRLRMAIWAGTCGAGTDCAMTVRSSSEPKR